jgi:hypothetical protein
VQEQAALALKHLSIGLYKLAREASIQASTVNPTPLQEVTFEVAVMQVMNEICRTNAGRLTAAQLRVARMLHERGWGPPA